MLLFLLFPLSFWGQEGKHAVRYSGQLSGYAQYTPDISPKVWLGGRYIPQINYSISLTGEKLLDFEGSANTYFEQSLIDNTGDSFHARIKPYRAWARYSSQQTEVRLGLQKLNFGSAMMFRPLMWFDKIDPRDPLQMTDGVWGGLFRYYFLNNANLWGWVLYGNKDTKGWELFPVDRHTPEAGGRVQLPLSSGEMAFSYHYRKANVSGEDDDWLGGVTKLSENRIGFDLKLNLTVGLWMEGSWTSLSRNVRELTNQTMLTLGSDYTFNIGNGLLTTFEHLLYIGGEKAFSSDFSVNFSGLSFSYPVGLFDNLQAMFYYDWTDSNVYNFINWQKQYNAVSFYLMAYWNPSQFQVPGMMGEANRFNGKGIQLMVVWNH